MLTCDYCGKTIPAHVFARRHKKPQRLNFCDKEHRAAYDRQTGFFKRMSEVGKDARSIAVTKSNQEHPRRTKRGTA